ncbi:hypothetical protein KZ770_11355 [Escherichia coli]|nr:hypothetical protein [Escherichia coli]
MKKTARRRSDGVLKEVLFVEEDSQFRLCSDPSALFACFKKARSSMSYRAFSGGLSDASGCSGWSFQPRQQRHFAHQE